MAAAAFFWNKYLDKKENTPMEKVDVSDIETTAPALRCVAIPAYHRCIPI